MIFGVIAIALICNSEKLLVTDQDIRVVNNNMRSTWRTILLNLDSCVNLKGIISDKKIAVEFEKQLSTSKIKELFRGLLDVAIKVKEKSTLAIFNGNEFYDAEEYLTDFEAHYCKKWTARQYVLRFLLSRTMKRCHSMIKATLQFLEYQLHSYSFSKLTQEKKTLIQSQFIAEDTVQQAEIEAFKSEEAITIKNRFQVDSGSLDLVEKLSFYKDIEQCRTCRGDEMHRYPFLLFDFVQCMNSIFERVWEKNQMTIQIYLKPNIKSLPLKCKRVYFYLHYLCKNSNNKDFFYNLYFKSIEY